MLHKKTGVYENVNNQSERIYEVGVGNTIDVPIYVS